MKLLKGSIKKSSDSENEQKKAMIETKKVLKSKDKEIYNLETKADNSLGTVNNLKESNTALKKEKAKVEKKVKMLENKLKHETSKPTSNSKVIPSYPKSSNLDPFSSILSKPTLSTTESLASSANVIPSSYYFPQTKPAIDFLISSQSTLTMNTFSNTKISTMNSQKKSSPLTSLDNPPSLTIFSPSTHAPPSSIG